MALNFPHIIEGENDLTGFLATAKDEIGKVLQDVGTVLFRGFAIPNPEAFHSVVEAYGEAAFTYEESLSNAVRLNVTSRVFTANEAPSDVEIFLHHEMAQTPIFPSKLMFYCEVAPEYGGTTPLCRSDALFSELELRDPEVASAFDSRGVRYSNVMPSENDKLSGQGRSWRATLGVDTPSAAEERLDFLGYKWEWRENHTLRVISPKLPAVRTLKDGRKTFFNQLIAAFCGWSDKRNSASSSVTFGDGEPITMEHMRSPIEISRELTYDHEWRVGDVVLIDNFLVMHGRRPFRGQRRILASLIN